MRVGVRRGRLSLADARDRAKAVLQDVEIDLDPAAERELSAELKTIPAHA